MKEPSPPKKFSHRDAPLDLEDAMACAKETLKKRKVSKMKDSSAPFSPARSNNSKESGALVRKPKK